jgi:hypothetical protein
MTTPTRVTTMTTTASGATGRWRPGHRCFVGAGLVCAGLVLASTGCGQAGTGRAPTAPVAGVMTLGGQPLADVTITFTPAAGRPATGRTDATGRFTLSTFAAGDGAVPGEHRVTLSVPAVDVPMPGTPEAAGYIPAKRAFPERYGGLDTTDLRVEIPAAGARDLRLELPAG